MSYLLVLDVGIGSIWVVIFDFNGCQLVVGQVEWKYLSVDNVFGLMEFDFIINWQLVCQCICQVFDVVWFFVVDIQFVVCCLMCEGIVFYDCDGEVIWVCVNVDVCVSCEVVEFKEIYDYCFEFEVYEVLG